MTRAPHIGRVMAGGRSRVRRSRARRLSIAPAALLVALATLATAAPGAWAATTSVWREGVGRSFSIESCDPGVAVRGRSDESVALEPIVSWRLDVSSPIYAGFDPMQVDPRCIRPLDDGKVLVVNRLGTEEASAFIAVVRRDGSEAWSYRRSDDAQLSKPFCAERMVRDGRQYTLIADRWAARVFAVDADKRIVWQYGAVGDPGLGVDRLMDPYWATYTDDDTVLIADNLGGHRVIEVRWADYDADAPRHGFSAESIVWQYGSPGEAGSAAGLLKKPRSPQRLPGAGRHTLITDAEAHVVYEVDRTGRIVWQFGVVDDPGVPENGRLRDPTYAERLSDGTTVIADTNNGLVVRVDAQGDVLETHDLTRLQPPDWASATDAAEPRMVTQAADGALLIADSGFGRFVEVGLPEQASFTSSRLNMGQRLARKRFVSLSWVGAAPGGTAVRLAYRIDEGGWFDVPPGGSLPAAAVGRSIRYRATLVGAGRSASPTVDAIEIRWRKVAAADTPPADVTPAAKGPGVVDMGGEGSRAGPAGTVTWAGSGTGSGTPGGPSGGGHGDGDVGGVGALAAEAAPESLVDPSVAGAAVPVTGSPLRLEPGGGHGGGSTGSAADAASALESPTVWAGLAAVLLLATAVPALAGRRLRERTIAPGDVPATATRDARLLEGAP